MISPQDLFDRYQAIIHDQNELANILVEKLDKLKLRMYEVQRQMEESESDNLRLRRENLDMKKKLLTQSPSYKEITRL